MWKIFEIFTKKYKKEVEHYEFLQKMKENNEIKLKCGDTESIDDKINQLRKLENRNKN